MQFAFESLLNVGVRRTVIVVTNDGTVTVHVTPRGVTEACWEGEVESDRLDADVGVVVNLSNAPHHAVVELLELDPLRHRRNQQQRVAEGVTSKWLVDDLICNDMRVASQPLRNGLPVGHKLPMQVMLRIVEMVKSAPHIVTHVILPPILLVTILPGRYPTLIERHLLETPREGETAIAMDLVDKPHRNPIPTVLLGYDVLVEIDQSVDALLTKAVNEVDHLVEIGGVVPVLLGLDPRPPASHQTYMAPSRTPFIPSY